MVYYHYSIGIIIFVVLISKPVGSLYFLKCLLSDIFEMLDEYLLLHKNGSENWKKGSKILECHIDLGKAVEFATQKYNEWNQRDEGTWLNNSLYLFCGL